MTEESNISSILTQYLRHELPPSRMSEIKHLITTDPTWIKEYQSILSLSQGIRHTTLHDLQSTLKNIEKTITPSGDLSPTPTYIYESNETSGLETPPLTPRDGHEASDNRLIQGIRYTSLQDELKKLKKIENTVKEQTEQNTKKNESAPKGARVVGMKWWAVAAVLAGIAFYFGYYQPKREQDELYKKYFVPYEYSGDFRSEPGQKLSEHDSLVKQGIAWYVHGEYGKAVRCFEGVIPENMTEEQIIIYIYSILGSRKNMLKYNNLLPLLKSKSIKDSIHQLNLKLHE